MAVNDQKPHFGKKLNPFQKGVYLSMGTVSLLLGLLGIPLPLLPTTPFLLLSAWCYARSSERFYYRLLSHPYLGSYIRDYHQKGGVRRQIKIIAIVFLWITISLSAFLLVSLVWVRLLLFAIATGVTIHILSLKTVRNTRDQKR